ncbi:MAG TPA: hypothetical protein VG389_28500 [Myxococcota bacterium]|jgi:hypothetical protein|nr:hypothetical protein [Myxococcota bacterium]
MAAKKSLMRMLIQAAENGVGFSVDAEQVDNDLPMDWQDRVKAAAGVDAEDVPFVFFQDGKVEAQFQFPPDDEQS